MLGILLVVLGFPRSPQALVDRIVAIVNQEIITLSEVEKRMEMTHAEIVAEDRLEKKSKIQEVRRQVLEALIEEKLIDHEVKKAGIKVTPAEVDAVIEDIKRRNQFTEEDFERALGREGLTVETLRGQIEKNLLRTKFLQWSVKPEIKSGEEDVRAYYEKNQDRYRQAETYELAQILFIVPKQAAPEETREIRTRCQKVLDRIREGADFGEMALRHSQDVSAKDRGNLGTFKRGELVAPIEKTVLRLKVGEVSEVVRTEAGYHLFKLLSREGGAPVPFEEIKERVMADYLASEREKALKRFMSSLREKSVIEMRL